MPVCLPQRAGGAENRRMGTGLDVTLELPAEGGWYQVSRAGLGARYQCWRYFWRIEGASVIKKQAGWYRARFNLSSLAA